MDLFKVQFSSCETCIKKILIARQFEYKFNSHLTLLKAGEMAMFIIKTRPSFIAVNEFDCVRIFFVEISLIACFFLLRKKTIKILHFLKDGFVLMRHHRFLIPARRNYKRLGIWGVYVDGSRRNRELDMNKSPHFDVLSISILKK